jgi:hypothetical protein
MEAEMERRVSCWMALAALQALLAQGCAAPAPAAVPQAPLLTIDAARYDEAFDAVLRACAEASLPVAFRDRRGGTVWTQPVSAPSLIEPWWWWRGSRHLSLEDTLNHHRAWAVIEFRPAEAPPGPEALEGPQGPRVPDPAAPPDLLALRAEGDLTRHAGPMTMQVCVYLERQEGVGLRRDTWSRRVSSAAQVIDPATEEPVAATSWVAVGRDPVREERLLAAIRQSLER